MNQETSGAEGDAPKSNDGDGDNSTVFECNICLDTARDAVVSMCGHLFCWPCLHQWLETRPNRQTCPVCKAGISRDQVVPIYGRGSNDKKDPRCHVIHGTSKNHSTPFHPNLCPTCSPLPDANQPCCPGDKLPPRPQGQRAEPEAQGGFPGFGFNDGGFQMSFGIGAFPFGMFASTFNFNNGRPAPPSPGSMQHREEQILSKFFLVVAMIFIIWLLFT